MFRVFRLKRDEKGQSMVEFALILPILLLIVMGIIEFGWLFNGKITLSSAAREGARVASVIDESTAEDAIMSTSGLSGLTIDETKIKFEYSGSGPDKRVKVTVPATIKSLTKFFPLIPSVVNLESEAWMRMEYGE